MTLQRKEAPKYFIPTFMIWIFLCNVTAIILAIVWAIQFPESFWFNSTVSMFIIIGINVLSIILLYPLLNMDPLTPFLKGALIWYVIISIVYIVLAAYFALIPGTIQLLGDLWYHWKRKKLVKQKE
ncbi:MAG: hypothetical protein GF383_07780 [Candidatus Lokiarchaeota archaeon]|nr:hypothetical protein [Candidatus Lokiarchaeota archaeon]MBD3340170.1 hypothetical protein [Candidatus Lokiarchaeota archaeon]